MKLLINTTLPFIKRKIFKKLFQVYILIKKFTSYGITCVWNDIICRCHIQMFTQVCYKNYFITRIEFT